MTLKNLLARAIRLNIYYLVRQDFSEDTDNITNSVQRTLKYIGFQEVQRPKTKTKGKSIRRLKRTNFSERSQSKAIDAILKDVLAKNIKHYTSPTEKGRITVISHPGFYQGCHYDQVLCTIGLHPNITETIPRGSLERYIVPREYNKECTLHSSKYLS